MKKFISLFTALALVFALCIFLPEGVIKAGASDYEPGGFEFSGRIVLVGDSTVCNYSESFSKQLGDRYGWGMKLAENFEGVTVLNYAVGGASTLNYLPLPQYAQMKETLGKGDYLFIQFGHNDEATTDKRGTYPGLDKDTLDENGKDPQGRYSYEFLLMKYYVQLARDKGAVPVLITPITVLGTDYLPYYERHIPYQNAMKALAAENNIPLIDMTTKTVELYNKLYQTGGSDATKKMHCYTNAAKTVLDHTHLSEYGAATIAPIIANETKTLGLTVGSCLPGSADTDCKHTETYTVKEVISQPTCIKAGSYEEVVYCSACRKELSRVKHEETAKGHNFAANIRYEWSDDGKTCKGYGTCTCRAYTYEVATVTPSVKTPATSSTMGVTRYTAAFVNQPFTTQTKDVEDIPKLPAAFLAGDADNNGKVDVSDVLLVQQYLASWDVDIDLDAADYDGDGEVNVGDVLLTQQKIAGWEFDT